eukprot:6177174-Pleurochrysis_carterae.AAC.4
MQMKASALHSVCCNKCTAITQIGRRTSIPFRSNLRCSCKVAECVAKESEVADAKADRRTEALRAWSAA